MTASCEERITWLADRHLTSNIADRMSSLAAAMGCHNVDMRSSGPVVEELADLDPAHEGLVRKVLSRWLLHRRSGRELDNISMVDGFVRNERWRDCIQDNERAYRFATALICFAMSREDYLRGRFESAPNFKARLAFWALVSPGAIAQVNEWLRPEQPFTEYPSSTELIKLVFGTAWYDLAGLVPFNDMDQVHDIIQAHRPPFLPGLLPVQLEQEVVALPTMD
jgi:hypothetical protein